MPWTAIFAVVALLGLQLAIAAASLYAYNRIRGQQDSQGQERLQWSVQVNAAVSQADSAMKKAQEIETAHFGKLRALFEAQAVELADARSRIVSLEKELKVCQMKLASEERILRRDEKRAAKEAAVEPAQGMPTAPGAAGVDDLVRKGIAIPLGPNQPGPAATRDPTFGRVTR